MPASPKNLTVIPVGHPYLLDEKRSSDLIYMSWGSRYYGQSPIPMSLHDGWVYVLVRAGSPLFLRKDKSAKRINPGQLVVIGPNYPSGWGDLGRRRCDQMAWVWKGDPHFTNISVPRNQCVILNLNGRAVQRLCQIHEQCREQVSRPDPLTPKTLRALRQLLEAELDRSRLPQSPTAISRWEFALAWLEHHWQEECVSTRLAEYLQISHSTLNRLFQDQIGISLTEWIHARRMVRAEEMILSGRLLRKEIAFELGYKHANDFSRAWARWRNRQTPAKDCG